MSNGESIGAEEHRLPLPAERLSHANGTVNGTSRKRVVVVGLGMVGVAFV